MELQGIQHTASVRAGTHEVAMPYSGRPTAKRVREATQEVSGTATIHREEETHAGADVGIPPALDAAHPRIRMDERIGRLIAQIVDENDVVIRQIPPEEQVRLALRIRQTQGILFDKRV